MFIKIARVGDSLGGDDVFGLDDTTYRIVAGLAIVGVIGVVGVVLFGAYTLVGWMF